MTKLSYTLGMKVFACFIAVLSGITAFSTVLVSFWQTATTFTAAALQN